MNKCDFLKFIGVSLVLMLLVGMVVGSDLGKNVIEFLSNIIGLVIFIFIVE